MTLLVIPPIPGTFVHATVIPPVAMPFGRTASPRPSADNSILKTHDRSESRFKEMLL